MRTSWFLITRDSLSSQLAVRKPKPAKTKEAKENTNPNAGKTKEAKAKSGELELVFQTCSNHVHLM